MAKVSAKDHKDRRRMVRLVELGDLRIQQVARMFGVNRGTVTRWRALYAKHPEIVEAREQRRRSGGKSPRPVAGAGPASEGD